MKPRIIERVDDLHVCHNSSIQSQQFSQFRYHFNRILVPLSPPRLQRVEQPARAIFVPSVDGAIHRLKRADILALSPMLPVSAARKLFRAVSNSHADAELAIDDA